MSSKKASSVKYSLSKDGSFNIADYNHSRTFSNFFPGVAGVWGIPMWAFYVNRGQCIASFGIEDKDKAILEFQPANKAYRLTPLQGFRTFIKIRSGKKAVYWEPFQKNLLGTEFRKDQTLAITPHDLTIEETNHALGLSIRIKYFTVPQEPFAALVREVTIRNLKKSNVQLELLDGLPAINCYGLRDWLTKHMARTAEAWITVRHIKEKAPFYQLTVEIADKPEVTHLKEGNFFFSLRTDGKAPQLIDPIVEAAAIFGEASDYSAPEAFLQSTFKLPKDQKTSNKTPCAFGYQHISLKAKQEHTFVSYYGYAHDVDELQKTVIKAAQKRFLKDKEEANKRTIDEIRNFCFTNSASESFNLYAGHTFLDNVLRGGLPVSLNTKDGPVAFNVYSRKHGDLERDYNYFNLSPTFYSQGNGNYRDVNQNRRNDAWFNTDVRDEHLKTFLNLVQADGYNPLIVKGATFTVTDKERLKAILKETGADERVSVFLEKPFRPGDLLTLLSHKNIPLTVDVKEFLGRLLEICHKQESAEHGEGFWTDHWTYNLDLIDSYLSLYPDYLRELVLEQKDFSFYHNDHYVLPRDQRYILKAHGVRQYASVHHPPKEEAHKKKKSHDLRVKQGAGPVYKTNLVVKLLCLIANKIATLDPSGRGVEMEADKPNWYDALNGLPGLLGSSLAETIEIKRFSQFLLGAINKLKLSDDEKIPVFEELATFLAGLENLLMLEEDPVSYWQKANDIKERYRQRLRNGIDGAEAPVPVREIRDFLTQTIKRVNQAVAKSKDARGFLPTYFYHEVTAYDKLDRSSTDEVVYVRPKSFKCHTLPPFLEGYVHALRASSDVQEARELYRRVRESDLFDKPLKMYKVNTGLLSQTEEIGRSRIFPKGWLENESVWLHMEYKLMLELLRCDLHAEYYENFRNVLVPFLRPEVYGRSILENSSFIVSSVHEDSHVHGQGFVARLSGSTAEFVHMWLYMNMGLKPFTLNAKGELQLSFEPILEGSLFTTKATSAEFCRNGQWELVEFPKDSYAFNLLNGTLVVYHNPKRRNTFGSNKARVKSIKLKYPHQSIATEIKSSVIPSAQAQDVRERRVERIDVFLE